jgi:hypothetical protein
MKATQFERSLCGIPQSTQDRSLNAKYKIETFYKHSSQQVKERMNRYRLFVEINFKSQIEIQFGRSKG